MPALRIRGPDAEVDLNIGSAMPVFICPNCGNRLTSQDRTAGFSAKPRGCAKCGFGFMFELLDDYYPAPDAAFFVCDAEARIIGCGRGSFELTGLKESGYKLDTSSEHGLAPYDGKIEINVIAAKPTAVARKALLKLGIPSGSSRYCQRHARIARLTNIVSSDNVNQSNRA